MKLRACKKRATYLGYSSFINFRSLPLFNSFSRSVFSIRKISLELLNFNFINRNYQNHQNFSFKLFKAPQLIFIPFNTMQRRLHNDINEIQLINTIFHEKYK